MPRATVMLVLAMFMAASPKTLGQTSAAPDRNGALRRELATVEAEITAAKEENEKYSGGLVKALIESRIATLQQTYAMLDQVLKAGKFGVTLHYTVNGKPFALPPGAHEELASVERELQEIDARILTQQAEAERYSGGLVQALAYSTLATSRQTRAMLEQRQLALKHGLPQYVGFVNESATPSSARAESTEKNPRVSPPKADETEIVSIDTRVTESNSTWSKYAWKLTLRNKSARPARFEATIEWYDSDGFIVDTDRARDLVVPAQGEETFTGYALINADVAGKVAKIGAKVGRSH
jgi:hypothetical protein